MSRLNEALRRFWTWLNMPVPAVPAADPWTARDWADLPPYHPLSDCTPR